MSQDYYKLLEVDRNADAETLKKAFRKQSLKWHPDRNSDSNATEMFQNINEAYEVLSDNQKRHIYDTQGIEGLKGGNQRQHHMDPNEIFSQMFGHGFNPFGGLGGRMHFNFSFNNAHNRHERQKVAKGPSRKTEVKLTINEMMNGVEKHISFNRKVKCVDCLGSGLKKGCDDNKCKGCDGKGLVTRIAQIGPGMIQQSTVTCSECGGKGKKIRLEDTCLTCKGVKFLDETRMITVHVPKGTKSGENVILNNLSDDTEDAIVAGDHIILFIEETNDTLKRVDYDLIIKKNILLSEAISGLLINFIHPNGDKIKIKFDEVIKPGQIFKINGLGFWNKDMNKNGDLIFEFNIIFPDKIEDRRKELIRKLLPKRKSDIHELEENKKEYILERISSNSSNDKKYDKVDFDDDYYEL